MTPEQRARLSALLGKTQGDLTASEQSEITFLSQISAGVPVGQVGSETEETEETETEETEETETEETEETETEETEETETEEAAPAPVAKNGKLSIGAKFLALAKSKVTLQAALVAERKKTAGLEASLTALTAVQGALKTKAKVTKKALKASKQKETTINAAVADELASLGISAEDLVDGVSGADQKPDIDCKAETNPRKLIALGRKTQAALN